jgi:CRISPR system Cascade subunit CasA
MNKGFNLLDEPWIPVRMIDGQLRDVGLLKLFEQAKEINALAETSPPSLIALYRMLLAITHRALTGAQGTWWDRDRAAWYREGLPKQALQNYLEHWRERFWLFHPDQPFMQVAALATAAEIKKKTPWTKISLANASGDDPAVFDHSCDRTPTAITPSDATRTLLGFLQFTPGGLVRVMRGSDNAGPLVNTAAVLPVGETLNETLCLALQPPASASMNDLPSWEKPAASLEDLRSVPSLATGSNDRYTRLSRAVLLDPEDDYRIRWIRFAAGVALKNDENAPDPMASYRSGSNGLVRVSFSEGRAFWRDLPALVPDAEGKASQPASVLGWAANLRWVLGGVQNDEVLLVAGIASKEMKCKRWRSEQIALPVSLLSNPDLARYLRIEVSQAETVYSKLREIAVTIIAETMSSAKPKRKALSRARDLFTDKAVAITFFSCAERALPRLLREIAEEKGDEAHLHWSQSLSQSVRDTWEVVRRNLGQTPLALRAEVRAFPRISALLHTLQPESSIAVSREALQ